MAPLPLRLKFHPPQSSSLSFSFRPFSSSNLPFPDLNPNPNPDENPNPTPKSQSSFFSDIKSSLRSSPPPPRRLPDDPPPPPPISSNRSSAASLDDIRKNLAEFRLRSSAPNPKPQGHRPMSFQDLFRNQQDPNLKPDPATTGRISYDSIRDKFRQFQPNESPSRRFGLRPSAMARTPSLTGEQEGLPESIFGREIREKRGDKGAGDGEETGMKTEFVKMYSHEELGAKLKKLRPDAAEKGGKDWFSLEELNVRLAKLRELEDKETEARTGGV